MRIRPALLATSAIALLVLVIGGWLLLRPVDPAGGAVPAPITVPERAPIGPVQPTPAPPADPAPETAVPTDVVPPPPVPDDDDDGPDDDGPDDDGPDDDGD